MASVASAALGDMLRTPNWHAQWPMTQLPECTQKQIPLSSMPSGQTQYYTTFRACAANGYCKEVAGPPLRPADNLYASAAFKKDSPQRSKSEAIVSLFTVGAPMRKLVDHLTNVHRGQDWRLMIDPTHSEWTKHHQLPATHPDDLTFLDAFSITLERRYSVGGLPSLDVDWSAVRNTFDIAPTKVHTEELNKMAAKHARVKNRALHGSNDEAAHASYWDKRVVRVSRPPYSPPAELCDSVTGYEVRGSVPATTNKIHYTIFDETAIEHQNALRNGRRPQPTQWREFEEDQPQKRATSPAMDFNSTGVAVSRRTYVNGGDTTAIHLPVMQTTTPVSELTLQVDFYKMLLESSAAQKGGGGRIARAIHTGRSSDYLLWRSMPELRSALADTATKDNFAAQCLMARIGGFHVPAAMAALRELVGGDSMEFTTQLKLEYLNGGLYVSLAYLPGTDPIEWPDSDDDDEVEEDDDERAPSSEFGSELL